MAFRRAVGALYSLGAAIPLGETAKVAVGTSIIVGVSVYTVFGCECVVVARATLCPV
jgi:hypothetical protein